MAKTELEKLAAFILAFCEDHAETIAHRCDRGVASLVGDTRRVSHSPRSTGRPLRVRRRDGRSHRARFSIRHASPPEPDDGGPVPFRDGLSRSRARRATSSAVRPWPRMGGVATCRLGRRYTDTARSARCVGHVDSGCTGHYFPPGLSHQLARMSSTSSRGSDIARGWDEPFGLEPTCRCCTCIPKGARK